MPDARLAYRPFAEQVAFFERKVNTPSERWDDLKLGDHAHGFMVAGAQRAALLDDLRGAVGRAIKEGKGFEAFQGEFESIVAKNGWTGWTGEGSAAGRAWRARTIYNTNIRQSYNAGRYAQLTHPDMVEVRPFWEYRHGERGVSKVPRPEHQAWHGLVLRWDHPWWKTHYPANGWGCNCGVRAHGEDDLKRRGLSVGTAPEGGTAGIDQGFEYNVGEASRSLPAAASYGQKVMQMPKAARKVALDDAQERNVNWLAPEWRSIVDELDQQYLDDVPRRALRRRGAPAGFMPARVVDALDAGVGTTVATGGARSFAAFSPPSALISTGDEYLSHVLGDLPKAGALRREIVDVVRATPERLADKATIWLIDPLDGKTLIAVWPDDAGAFWKLVVRSKTMMMNRNRVPGYHMTTLERRSREQLSGYIVLTGDFK